MPAFRTDGFELYDPTDQTKRLRFSCAGIPHGSCRAITAPTAAGTLTTTIGWTDDVGATTATPAAALTLVGTGRDYGSAYLRHAGGNITYAVALAGVVGSPVYRLDLALSRLS